MLPSSLASAVIPAPVLEVLRGLQSGGHAAFLVGGCVRDLLRGTPPKDFDVASSALPEEVQRLFRKVLPTGIAHGTVTVMSQGTPVEVTTFRSEGSYLDGRRPSSVRFEREVHTDLSRRDFTLNAMAFNPEQGLLVDPFGGQEDLKAGCLRCVGTALARFSEDGLRPLRAVRFAAVLDFTLEPSTEAAIAQTLEVFGRVSAERIREELNKLVVAPAAPKGLALLKQTGLLQAFAPELVDHLDTALAASIARLPPDLELRLAALLSPLASPAAKDLLLRLRSPNRLVERVGRMVDHLVQLPSLQAPDAALRRFVASLGAELLPSLLSVAYAKAETDAGQREQGLLRARFEKLLEQKPPLSPRDLALKGKDIMEALGVGAGPIVGEATRYLMDQILEDPRLNDAEQLRDRLRQWTGERKP